MSIWSDAPLRRFELLAEYLAVLERLDVLKKRRARRRTILVIALLVLVVVRVVAALRNCI